ncbi:23S rRNA (adenine(2030)-N(6))-methyltransferase RlmJ [Niveibacterium microcysteis]|uniref:Ribosomal RNA large subunit methyltransferase J n=1 Tax=Niveibacterium microcysteis TaxID=2811415 RepID=A0ABX7M2Y8_9RHOO|nr:23S rRNA (adenine(2030)-N(6))-methyltransferase RlmJ [Niveibacterium microcysteis]QSI75749.1 23S rRNA (adenine(2030)-N(6))-methyltransferase RlmJ [Niveibacterium microcysteis]
MLSYRHAFHAGNHADVLKHFVEVELLRYLNQKEKAWWYIDTHAGAGAYELDRGYAAQNAEFESGIARIVDAPDLPPALGAYIDLVRRFNGPGALKHYPGSPWFAAELMREQDRMRLFELHPADADLLAENFEPLAKQLIVDRADGFKGLKAFLPPPPRRALVLIDPPYEVKSDYRTVVSTLQDALQRFATGTYAVWYPLLQRPECHELPRQLKELPAKSWLHVTLSVHKPALSGLGMHGSGLVVLNPPWTLADTLKQTMPWLVGKLAQDTHARYQLETGGAE